METWWVIGNGMDAGKTTIASTLIQLLDARKSAIGFKPRAHYRIHKYFEDFFAYSSNERLMNCGDGYHLSTNSSLSSVDDIELLVPFQMISSMNFKVPYLVRSGSDQIARRTILTSPFLHDFLKTPLDANTADPMAFLQHADTRDQEIGFKFPRSYRQSQDCIEQSFAKLQERQPAHIVIEGAGQFLPLWRKNTLVNHLVIVGGFEVQLYHNIGLELHWKQPELPQYGHLLPHLTKQQLTKSASIPITTPDRYTAVAKSVLEGLLSDVT
ncbi:hypothetical protein NNA36_11920 [Shimia sp. CNT1-13L.2]|uniref:hypothetical protein n=1 Tax=Shimia sp. CNT1-13L.2 TaxID=2959663 RepID=UPI0020CC7E77|nr:hypothetical protein [Shimia sp. CNT1-13L.2]MCP9482668.1 hypothetical protein [Shimia sp. CNT1-13L.2]